MGLFGLFSNKEKELTDAIINAYVEHEGEVILTNVDFKYAEKLIKDNGDKINRYDDGGVGGSITIRTESDTLHVTLTQSRVNGNASISVFGDKKFKEVTQNHLNKFLDN